MRKHSPLALTLTVGGLMSIIIFFWAMTFRETIRTIVAERKTTLYPTEEFQQHITKSMIEIQQSFASARTVFSQTGLLPTPSQELILTLKEKLRNRTNHNAREETTITTKDN